MGSVLLDGTSVSDEPMAAKRRIGYLPEANPLYDELIVAEYLDYVAELADRLEVQLDQIAVGVPGIGPRAGQRRRC